MAQNSWPSPAHNARNVTDDEYERIASRFSDDGVDGDPSDTVVTAGTGLSVVIPAGLYGSVRGHAWESGTTDVTLPISANASGLTRWDWVCLRLDRADWTVRAAIKEGTPGANVPTLLRQDLSTGVWEIPLAAVYVVNGATSVIVTPYTQFIGTRVRPTTSSVRPARRVGEINYETDTGRWVGYNGSTTQTISEDTGKVNLGTGFATWEQSAACYGRKVNGVVSLRLALRRVDSTFSVNDSDGSLLATVPAELRPTNEWQMFTGRFTSSGGVCRVEVRNNGEIWARYPTENVTVGRVLELTMTYIP
ncbi:hypothetical protein [Streptomyces lycii]|uniref:Minor tail protein n=1 Tax=Streptomyces lycii TaxID=2654337 RepID=A0ABQ7FLJ9_9ACTN|nr:hypothetical protein [Streptomyces lycii]KAF4408651.1 hypothetical protein GCU69_13210 [Streptomyces lycii]